MCRAASFVITEHAAHWLPWCDSHEEIIKKRGLKDDPEKIVRIEIVPEGGDYSLPLDKWVFSIDQDIRPSWYTDEDAEHAAREQLDAWAEYHIIRDREATIDLTGIGSASVIVLSRGVANVTGQTGGNCRAYSGGTVNSTDQAGGNCRAYSGGTVNLTGQAGGYCLAHGGGTVNKN